MFGVTVTETNAGAIRTAFEQGGVLSAAIELRRRFPGITVNAKVRQCARSIAGWTTPASIVRSAGTADDAGR